MTGRISSLFVIGLAICINSAQSKANTRMKQKEPVGAGNRFFDGRTINIPLGEKGTHDLYLKWMEQAISGLIAAIANEESERISDHDQNHLFHCSKNATSVPSHAKCLVQAIDAPKISKIPDQTKQTKHHKEKLAETTQTTTLKPTQPTQTTKAKKRYEWRNVAKRIQFVSKEQRPNDEVKWVGGFGVDNRRRRLLRLRGKRQTPVQHAVTYQLQSPDQRISAFGEVADFLTETVRSFKRKDGGNTWRGTYANLKMQTLQQKQKQAERDAIRARFKQLLEAPPEQLQNPRRPLAMKTLEMIPELKKHMEEYERETRENNSVSSPSPEQLEKARLPIALVREIVKIALAVAGENVTGFENKTMKLISPRLFSIVPEQNPDDIVNLLSPSLLSLHEEGNGIESLVSLPQILKRLNNQDQEKWMDFVMEAAGVSDVIDRLSQTERNEISEEDKRLLGTGKNGQPLFFTKKNVTDMFGKDEERKFDTWEKLHGSYTDEQMRDMKGRGFAFLERHQLDTLYGDDSPYNDTKLGFDLDHYGNLTYDERESLLIYNIRALSTAKEFELEDLMGTSIYLKPFEQEEPVEPLEREENGSRVRDKRGNIIEKNIVTTIIFTNSPFISNGFVVLNNLLLSPVILSPAVLGPLILSPGLFIPILLSPRLLSPLVLNPLIGSPVILSPLALHPFILSPGIMNPFVLSPYMLTPVVLSPQVMAPHILSPFMLSPIVLSPAVLTPLILSPFLLCPVILSPQFLFALVLSPSALSPLVNSPLAVASLVASPSILS